MTILGKLVVREATRVVRATQRQRHRALERELSAYSTPADRADLAATLDRYPDHQTAEIRNILALQARTATVRPADCARPSQGSTSG